MDFGTFVRTRRVEKKISLRKLAELVGINFTYLSKIESGDFDPPAEDKIQLIAKHLDIDPDTLFALSNKVPRELRQLALRPKVPLLLRATEALDANQVEELITLAEGLKESK
jgi:transcriptional regulator with XRE-family HTH domain